MIGRITGTLIEKSPPVVCVDVNGVGYEIDVPMSTLYALPETGARVTLFTHLVVREDAQLLYGFGSSAERSTFRELIKVTGIGARTALAVLSGLSVAELSQAITLQETGRLTRVPGIGKKTAERLLLEMRGKLGADIGATRTRPAATRAISSTRCWRWATPTRNPRRRSRSCPTGWTCRKASAWRSRPWSARTGGPRP